jgi:hypothetical protein
VEDTRLGLGHLPAALLLDLVVGTAVCAEIAAAGPAALVVGDGVVQVRLPGGLPAARLAAGLIAGVDELPEAR